MGTVDSTPIVTHGFAHLGPGGETMSAKEAEEVFNKSPALFCDTPKCGKSGKLKCCQKCKVARYCSRECQVADWPLHKVSCRMAVRLVSSGASPALAGESALRRCARLFSARYEDTFLLATVCALRLHDDWAAIGRTACLATLEPRPHAEAGARFRLVDFVLLPIAEFQEAYAGRVAPPGSEALAAVTELFAEHARQRARLQREEHGQADYATVGLLFANRGPHELALPADEPPSVFRFKPIRIDKQLVAGMAAQLRKPSFDWRRTLEHQIQNDLPARSTPVTA